MKNIIILFFLLLVLESNGQSSKILNLIARGDHFFDKKQYSKAVENYTRAKELDDLYIPIYVKLADALFWNEQKEAALDIIDQAITIDSTCTDAYYLRSSFLRIWLFRYEESLLDINKAIQLDSLNCNLYLFRASLWEHILSDKETISKNQQLDIEKSILINPQYSHSYFYRGQIKLNFGDTIGGCIDIKKAIELGNDDAKYFLRYCKEKSEK